MSGAIRIARSRLGAVAVVAAVLLAGFAVRSWTATEPTVAGCEVASGQSSTYDGASDTIPLEEVRSGNGYGPNGPTPISAYITKQYAAIAVLQVVSRARPLVAEGWSASGNPLASVHDQLADPNSGHVIRPARFAVTRLFTGTLPHCIDLDVLGGSIGTRMDSSPLAPARFGVGDRMLGFFTTGPPLTAEYLLPVDGTRTVHLPFSETEVIDVDRWTPPTPPTTPRGVAAPPAIPTEGCPPAPGQSTTDDGSADTTPLVPGALGRSGHGDPGGGEPPTTAQILASYDAVAVLTVVSRGPVTAVAGGGYGARPSIAHEPPGSDPGDWSLIRPARFSVTRVLKGSLPQCMDLDVPGGSSPDFAQHVEGDPPPFGVRDRAIAFVNAAHGSEPLTAWLTLVAPDGTVQIPFGDHETINVDTWTLPT